MSDFGAVLIIKKVAGDMRPGDKNLIASHLVSIIETGHYSGSIKDGPYKNLNEWNEANELCSMLTENYDNDGEESREFAEEEDMDDADEIAQKLRARLGPAFSVTASIEDW